MEDLLTPLKTTVITGETGVSNQLVPTQPDPSQQTNRPTTRHPQSVDEAWEILKTEPNLDALCATLKWLTSKNKVSGRLEIHGQSPKISQIIRTLVDDILPAYWESAEQTRLVESTTLKDSLQTCLKSAAGLSAILSRIQSLLKVKDGTQEKHHVRESEQARLLQHLLDLLDCILAQPSFIFCAWKDVSLSSHDRSQTTLLWREYANLLTNGRLVSLSAEGDRLIANSKPEINGRPWFVDGAKFSLWIGRNLEYMIVNLEEDDNDGWKALVQIFERSLSLGYAGQSVTTCFEASVLALENRYSNRRDFLPLASWI